MKKKFIDKLIFLYRRLIPQRIRIIIRAIIKFIYYRFRYFKLKTYLYITNKNVDLILGAALTKQKGWFSTNEGWLDISKQKDWERLFNSKKRVRKIFAEHVFEHLTFDEMRNALELIYQNMIYGGSLRIAVPDGNNPNDEYRKHCGINGIGADAKDHKQFLTFEILSKEVSQAGFEFKLIEGYLRNKKLISREYSNELGYIVRSRRNKKNKPKKGWDFVDSNTSLIIDCFKIKDKKN